MEGISRVKATPRGTLRMAPHDLKHLIALLDRAIRIEHEENRQLRSGCHEDCREYEWIPAEVTPERLLNTRLAVPSFLSLARYMMRPCDVSRCG
jgi:hypothetical protein